MDLYQLWEDLKQRPDIGEVMSNCDGEVRKGADTLLKDSKVVGGYPGWGFYGYVWFEDGKFRCLVLCYQSPQEVVEASSLEELMTAVSNVYGHR
jgi:hypothetical protein